MKFTASAHERDFKGPLLLDVRVLIEDLDDLCRHFGWPEVCVSDVRRTPEESKRIWLPWADELLARHRQGRTAGKEYTLARDLALLTPQQLEQWAAEKFSWHLEGCDCAVDLRNTDPQTGRRVYADPLTQDEVLELRQRYGLQTGGPLQHQAIEDWLRRHCTAPDWELITYLHGTGPHWHVARRSPERRTAYAMALARARGNA